MASDWQQGVVLISSASKNPPHQGNIGTGFVIHQDKAGTYLLTCAHVVKDMGGAENVLVHTGFPVQLVDSGFVEGSDLAVLRVKERVIEGRVENLKHLPVLSLSLQGKQGNDFETIGFWLKGENKQRRRDLIKGKLGKYGEVISRSGEYVKDWGLQIQGGDILRKGYSGSPVVQGSRVVAVVSHKENSESSEGYAISIEALPLIWKEIPPEIWNDRVVNSFNQLIEKPQVTESVSEPITEQKSQPPYFQSLQEFEFDVVTLNAQGQEIERKCNYNWYFQENLGNEMILEMVLIPGGTFQMGSPKGEGMDDERPQHEVTINPFFMGKYTVTQEQWRAVTSLPKVNRELKLEPSHFKGNKRPVERISWYQAVEFCQRLSQYTGKEYRLPSEAEWEYACRAGTTTPFHFGATITREFANCKRNLGMAIISLFAGETTEVGNFKVANAFGLYDMHGNVWEWCADTWHDHYKGAPADGRTWIEGSDDNRSLGRGGAWYDYPDECRSAFRNDDFKVPVFIFNFGIGFRVVCVAGSTP